MNRVFISYSRRNRTFTERLARDLSDAGLEVWVDFRQIHAGEMWEQEIYRGLERAQIVIICLSPDAIASEWVQREMEIAREQEKFIIPVMAMQALDALRQSESLRWLLQIQYIDFEDRYEAAFPDLLRALPGKRRVGPYDSVDESSIPNPFKGLEAFQQTDAAFFFGRESLIEKSLERLREDRENRFLAVVGASGSGKSSLVRAGVLPAIRAGRIPNSEQWRIAIFTPGDRPITALAERLSPLMESREAAAIDQMLHERPQHFEVLVDYSLEDAPPEAHLLLVVDQFEEVFTRASETEAENFLNIIQMAVTRPSGRAHVLITMRADFFDRLSRYPGLAELFEQENMVIVTEMTPPELLRSIEGPAQAVGLTYDIGLPQRILEEVRRQPGSLPLLQYALKELFQRREGLRLTKKAYAEIGGVEKALAQHAETIYAELGGAQQAIMRRILLRLVEVSETGEATRRRVAFHELRFRDVPETVVLELLDRLTAGDTRLLIASRQITARGDDSRPQTFYEVSHEALIREWDRFNGWVAENLENLRLGSEILQAASDWQASNYDTAYLLTGTRLTRAEAWLDEADATPLQREFMQASLSEAERQEALDRSRMERELALQRKATTRLRFGLVILVIGLLAVAALAALAVFAQQEAESQRVVAQDAERRAVFNLRRAISLSLSASANRELDAFNTEQAAKLAVNAALVELSDSEIPELSERTLADVVYRPGTRHLLSSDGVALVDAVFSADGTRTFGAAGNLIIAWDIRTATENGRWRGTDDLQHTREITAMAYNPTRPILASADVNGLILLWDATTGTPITALNGHTNNVNGLAFSPDGVHLVSGGSDRRVIWWNIDNGESFVLSEHAATINDVAISADGDSIASAGGDNRIGIWRINEGFSHYFLEGVAVGGHDAPVRALAFIDGTNLLSSGDDNGLVILWNYSLRRVADRLSEHGAAITRIRHDPTRNSIFSADADGIVLRWPVLPPRRVIHGFGDHRVRINGLHIHAPSQMMLTADDEGIMRVWDIQDSSNAGTLAIPGGVGLRAAYGLDDRVIFTTTASGIAHLWDAESGLIVQSFANADGIPNGRVNTMAFSHDGRTTLTAHGDGRVVLWDVASGDARLTLDGASGHDNATITAAKFFPDNQRLITGDTRGLMVIWDATNGAVLQRLTPKADKDDDGHEAMVNALAVHPDGRYILSVSQDGLIILWDALEGVALQTYDGHNRRAVTAVSFHPSGGYALTGAADGRVILWDTSAGLETRGTRQALVKLFDAHNARIIDIAFSPVRPQFATAAGDDRLIVWDIRNFIDLDAAVVADSLLLTAQAADDTAQAFDMRVFTIPQSEAFVSLEFSSDGKTIITGTSNGQLRRWRVFPFTRDLLTFMASNRLVDELSSAERELYQMENEPQMGDVYPWPTPTPTPQPMWNRPQVGEPAMVHSEDGSLLNVREAPGLGATQLFQLEKGMIVTIIDGPAEASGLIWWRVRTADGEEGWMAESIRTPRPVQILVPGLLAMSDG